jgi:tetratricopeptide (TPR) repeat protein
MRRTKIESALQLPFVVYLATLTAILLSSFFPSLRLWGIAVWAYLPLAVRCVLFVAGAAAGWMICQSPTGSDRSQRRKGSGGFVLSPLTVLLIAAVSALLFFLLRAGTYFLGDGVLQLNWLAGATQFLKSREFGAELVLVGVKSLVGGLFSRPELAAYQIVSIGSGVIGIVVLLLLSYRVKSESHGSVGQAAVLLTGGYMLLFFGYVENYALLVLTVMLFAYVGQLVASGRLPLWWILVITVLPPFVHLLGLAVVPAALLVVLMRLAPKLSIKVSPAILCAALAGVGLIGILGAYDMSTDNYQLRFMLLPLLQDRFTMDGYTLFSWRHLLDIVNLTVLLVPGIAVLVATTSRTAWRTVLTSPEGLFHLMFAATCLAIVLCVDPKLGMPRDWDALSLIGPALAGLVLFVARATEQKHFSKIVGLVCLLGLLSLLPRAWTLSNVKAGIAQARTYASLDPVRNRTGLGNVLDYLKQNGTQGEYGEILSQYQSAYQVEVILQEARSARVSGDMAKSKELCYRGLELSPQYSYLWFSLGEIYFHAANYDSALICDRIADAINPGNEQILNNLAVALIHKGEIEQAKQTLMVAMQINPVSVISPTNFALLYGQIGDTANYEKYFELAALRAKDAPDRLKTLGDFRLARGRVQYAALTYQQALKYGLDSSKLDSVVGAHDDLRRFLDWRRPTR